MKTTNVNQPGERSHGIVRGHVGVSRAGSSGITVTDGLTEVDEVTEARFRGASVTDLTDGVAEITITGTGNLKTNAAGRTLEQGEVVVLDAATNTVTTTTTAQDTRPVGIVQRSMLDGEAGPVVFQGEVPLVLVTASIIAGAYGETSATEGEAQSNPTRRVGSFCVFLTSGTAPSAMLFSQTDVSDTTVADTTDTFLTRRGGALPVVSTTTDSGSALILDLSTANVFDITLTANCTLTFINPPASGELGEWTLILRQDSTGSRTVTWPASVKWQAANGTDAGSAPTLFTAATAENVIDLSTLDGGTTYGAGSESGSSVSALDDLSDVQTSGEVAGAMLIFDGSVWRPGAPAEPLLLEDGTIAILENGHAAMAEPTYL